MSDRKTFHLVDLDPEWLPDDSASIEYTQENLVVGDITATWTEESYEQFDQHGNSYPSTTWKLWTWQLDAVTVNGEPVAISDLPPHVAAAFDSAGCERELRTQPPRNTNE